MYKALRIMVVSLLAVGLFLPGCQSARQGGGVSGSDVGAVVGGVAGGVLGAQFGKGSGKTAATIAGVLIGAGIGSYIGSSMDAQDRAEMNRTFENYPDNRTNTWRNPNTGGQYETTVTRTYEPRPQRYCREFTTNVKIDGKDTEAYGTACRQPDGSWKIEQMDEW